MRSIHYLLAGVQAEDCICRVNNICLISKQYFFHHAYSASAALTFYFIIFRLLKKKKIFFHSLCLSTINFFLMIFLSFSHFCYCRRWFCSFFHKFLYGTLFFFLLFSKYTIYMVILCGPTESNRNKFRKYDYRTRLLYSNGFLYLCFLLFFFIFTLFQLMCAWARCEWQQILLPLRTVFLCCCRCWRCCSRFSCLLLNSFSVFFHYLA